MPVSLLETRENSVSLEFDESDTDEVKTAIAGRYGPIRIIEKTPTYNEVEFGGERFIHYHEWTPCLISRSDKGETMLRLISASFPAKA